MKTFNKYLFTLLILINFSELSFSQTTKILTFNIRYDNPNDLENSWNNRKEKLVNLLRNYEPVIFGIQEGLPNQVAYIDSSLINYNYIGNGRDGNNKGEYSALFYNKTKYLVLESKTFWLSKTPDFVSKGWDAALPRICTYGLFKNLKTNRKIWIFNAHFDHIGEIARENSAKLIVKKIHEVNTENYPIVLMGDFNATPNKKPILYLKTQLDDALAISKKPLYGPIGTFNGFNKKPTVRKIDYFFTSNLKVLSYIHIDDRLNNNNYISDHFPVLIIVSNKE
ncbi:endonuclease/exonuclease/phosphatase family protein [Lutibacter sp.]|uniref:endonuclease/exonuclease/phosphatase family protein n=1 Tax=Lutibacter sp. TaxID=1925666 RepID=UPI0025C40F8F|nr:endonuclease/exonuclease/phosphatase family protein [Lutibacter sp.]MCF6180866.1 endonuclease/exonuclease/phosphatase family protein [Lutibacter sp.]